MLIDTVVKQTTDTHQMQIQASVKRRMLLSVLYTTALILLAAFLMDGWSYYTTAFAERPHHEDYRLLRPAGGRGLLRGIIGSVMMVLMLIYSLQKRLRIFGRRLRLRPFLDFHIFLGVVGPMFILLHTSFKVQGLVSIAFWSMVAVALSGYLGRYLYQQIPRNLNDQEMSLVDIESHSSRLQHEIQKRTKLNDATLADIEREFEAALSTKAKSLWQLVPALIFKDLRRPWIKRRLRRTFVRVRLVSPRDAEALFELAYRRAMLKRRLLLLDQIHRLFHWWHVIHKPFAIIMYLIMLVHIGVAIWTGYAWI
jgi:hypothetical protein